MGRRRNPNIVGGEWPAERPQLGHHRAENLRGSPVHWQDLNHRGGKKFLQLGEVPGFLLTAFEASEEFAEDRYRNADPLDAVEEGGDSRLATPE